MSRWRLRCRPCTPSARASCSEAFNSSVAPDSRQALSASRTSFHHLGISRPKTRNCTSFAPRSSVSSSWPRKVLGFLHLRRRDDVSGWQAQRLEDGQVSRRHRRGTDLPWCGPLQRLSFAAAGFAPPGAHEPGVQHHVAIRVAVPDTDEGPASLYADAELFLQLPLQRLAHRLARLHLASPETPTIRPGAHPRDGAPAVLGRQHPGARLRRLR